MMSLIEEYIINFLNKYICQRNKLKNIIMRQNNYIQQFCNNISPVSKLIIGKYKLYPILTYGILFSITI